METEETEQPPRPAVAQVLENGYMLHDRLLRPARVVVASPRNNRRRRQSNDATLARLLPRCRQELALAVDPYTTLGVKKDATRTIFKRPIAAWRRSCTRTSIPATRLLKINSRTVTAAYDL